jgi:hypothetical protein
MKVVHATDSRAVTYKVSLDGVTIEKPAYNVTDLLLVNGSADMVLPELSEADKQVGEISITDQREVDALLVNSPEVSVIRETRRPKPDEEGNYVIEKILAARKFGKVKKYRVKFEGYPIADAEWIPAREINAPDLMKEFRERERAKKKK